MKTEIRIKKPTKKELNEFFNDGVLQSQLTTKLTNTLKRDFFHRDKKTNKSYITEKLDHIINMESNDKQVLDEIKLVKAFVKKSLQTIIKNKACQQALLGDDYETKKVTLKKVNNSMINDTEGIYDGNFGEADYGSYRVVVEKKETKVEPTLIEALIKFIDAHETDTTEMRDLLTEIDAGVTQ